MTGVHILMLAGGLVLGMVAGSVMHRSDYCVAGMFRDLFLFRSSMMLKTLLLLITVSMPLFEFVRLLGLVSFPFPFFAPPSLVNIIGGFLFGIGMVLAGGCVVGTLYKLGSGSFSALLAFVGLIAGSTIYAFFHSDWVAIAKSVSLPISSVTIPQLLSLPPWILVIPLSLALAFLLRKWFRNGQMVRTAVVEGYLQPWKCAVVLALIGSASVLLVGMPLGITTSYSKAGAMLLNSLAPELAAGVSYFKLVALNYTPPLGGGVLTGGPGPALDGVSLVQFPLIIGILLGSAISAYRLREWRMRFSLPWRQVFSALLGGMLMGLASRMAPACNIWHLFGGLPILAIQSLLFLIGLLPGAWIGGLFFSRLVMPSVK